MGNLYWTFEKCKKEAMKYTTKTQWKTHSKGSYSSCSAHGWIDLVSAHMKSGRDYLCWTFQDCKKEAKKYKTRNEFKLKSGGAYCASCVNNWLDQICSHMPKFSTHDRHEELVVQPKVKSYLKKLGLQVEEEVFISKKSRVDFLCTNKVGRKIIVEVKSDKKSHSSNRMSEQVNRYQSEGKRKFGNQYACVLLVCLTGRYKNAIANNGYTLTEVRSILKAKGLI